MFSDEIIFNDCVYIDVLQVANLPLLAERRNQLTRHFFDKMRGVNNCLHYLLPAQHDSRIDSRITNSLHAAQKYPLLFAKSMLFQNSFILYDLANFQ